MIPFNWQQAVGGPVMSRAQLSQAANPTSTGQNEVIPHILFDTQSFTTAVTTNATYFQALPVDPTMSNTPGPGQLPDPYFLVIQYVACDFLIIPAVITDAANTPWSDEAELLINQRAIFSAKINDKNYGPYPLASCAPLGGLQGYSAFGTAAAAGSGWAGANNGFPGSGGFFVGGAWVIEPKIGFSFTVALAAAPTLAAGPVKVRLSLVGTLYRAIR